VKSLTPGNNWYARSLWIRVLTFIAFVIVVNLLAGYTAIYFNYPSLWGGNLAFSEYAFPVPLTWALSHWPSMLIFGIPLLFPSITQAKAVYRYRLVCAVTFLLCLLELDAKIPFVLFPKVDALTAFVFSLIIAPPNRQQNPALAPAVWASSIMIVLLLIYTGYSAWQHRTPTIRSSHLVGGLFELQSIEVDDGYRKELIFTVDLKDGQSREQTCESAQKMATELLREYPFDNDYHKVVYLIFKPRDAGTDFSPYSLGEVSLNSRDKDSNGQFACYIKYK